ncbi:mucin-2-like [Toxorhynchites rutilus septentrionalis]|uniref:mucin-2-like n=1 Tax=Toxorhynchites rutilus septentrionalis TaxID=329112 RepID=UPI00247B105D|nr:mucin-2-like [Toxorhynchites rutilus septentrionalis]
MKYSRLFVLLGVMVLTEATVIPLLAKGLFLKKHINIVAHKINEARFITDIPAKFLPIIVHKGKPYPPVVHPPTHYGETTTTTTTTTTPPPPSTTTSTPPPPPTTTTPPPPPPTVVPEPTTTLPPPSPSTRPPPCAPTATPAVPTTTTSAPPCLQTTTSPPLSTTILPCPLQTTTTTTELPIVQPTELPQLPYVPHETYGLPVEPPIQLPQLPYVPHDTYGLPVDTPLIVPEVPVPPATVPPEPHNEDSQHPQLQDSLYREETVFGENPSGQLIFFPAQPTISSDHPTSWEITVPAPDSPSIQTEPPSQQSPFSAGLTVPADSNVPVPFNVVSEVWSPSTKGNEPPAVVRYGPPAAGIPSWNR